MICPSRLSNDRCVTLLRHPRRVAGITLVLGLALAGLAALWQAIREFEPDYLFCPPVPADPPDSPSNSRCIGT